MSDQKKAKFPLALAGVVAALTLSAAIFSGGVGWAKFEAQRVTRAISSGPTPEEHVYASIGKIPFSLATFVQELRGVWRGESVATMHTAASELARGLLLHGDIEVGSIEGGKFVPWPMSRWKAAAKIETELTAMNEPLADENRYVFRRK